MRLEIIECDSHCIGGFGNDPSVLREQFPRFEETTRILRGGLGSAVRKPQLEADSSACRERESQRTAQTTPHDHMLPAKRNLLRKEVCHRD